MNAKSFLFAAVFVVLSFFAICFVWEARSALPENEGKDVSVGACEGGYSVTLKDDCPFQPQNLCDPKIEYDFPLILNGCKCSVVIPKLYTGCTCLQGRTHCEANDGNKILPDPEGGSVPITVDNGCGPYFEFNYEVEELPSLSYPHTCPKTGSTVTHYIKRFGCKSKDENATIKFCGDRNSTTGC